MAVRTIGETLQAARERRGISVAEVARTTRISEQFIRALEANDFAALPAPVYARGFIRSYANFLRLDSQPLLDALENDGVMPGGQAEIDAPTVIAPAPLILDPQVPASAPEPLGADEPPPIQSPVRSTFGEHRPRSAPPPPIAPSPAAPPAPRPQRQYTVAPGPVAEPQPAGRPRGVFLDEDNDGSIATRLLAILGVLAVLGAAAFVFFTLASGDDDGTVGADPDDDDNGGEGTIIEPTEDDGDFTTVVPDTTPTEAESETATPGGTTTPTPDANTTPSVTPTAEGTPTPTPDGPSPTPTSTPTVAPTATPDQETPTATATPTSPPTATPTPPATATPTATSPPTATPTTPPTATPIPTATPTPFPVPATYAYCTELPSNAGFDCGAAPITVVCTSAGHPIANPPGDLIANLPAGWYVAGTVATAGQAVSAC